MPETEVILYAAEDGESPFLSRSADWPAKARQQCYTRIERLQAAGYELRRPEADFLRDGIYELRIKHLGVHYRILYFFFKHSAVLFDGLTKEDRVPPKDINQVIRAKELFASDPDKHTYEVDEDEG